MEFDVTVRNLSASSQTVTVSFTVPEFTTYDGSPAGTAEATAFLPFYRDIRDRQIALCRLGRQPGATRWHRDYFDAD